MNKAGFEEKSYTSHETWYEQVTNPTERIHSKGTIDYWRHERMYDLALPLIAKGEEWLTVGDGSGTDANWLLSKGLKTVASDIADTILKVCKAECLIDAYSKENAEKLSFDNNSFDYVLCKESYLHFPRPYLALYELVRVARKGVVLIEPIDIGIKYSLIIALKNILDRINTYIINKVWKNRFSFESVGNYVYKISEREIEKAAMA